MTPEPILLWRDGKKCFVRYGKIQIEIEEWWYEHLKADSRAIVSD
jgi:hypothetical protein